MDNLKEIMQKENFVYPDSTLPNIIDVVRTIYTHCGTKESFQINDQIKNIIPNKKNILFILVDGMGSNLIDNLPDTSILKSHHLLDINTVFPTTTGCVLPSIAMAKYPATHGLYGWYGYNHDLKLNFKTLPYLNRDTLEPLTISPNEIFKYPSIMDNLSRRTHAIFPENLVNSIYSNYVASENKRKSYSNYECIPPMINNLLKESPENFIYLYISQVDSKEHKLGPYSEETKEELSKVELLIENIINTVNSNDFLVVITADHGQLTIHEEVTMDFDKYNKYNKYFYALPTIDFGTASYFVKKPYQKQFIEEFTKDYKNKMYLFSSDELYDQNFFGNEKTKEGRSGLGEYISICVPGVVFVNDCILKTLNIKGNHTGLTPEEIKIPLIVIEK